MPGADNMANPAVSKVTATGYSLYGSLERHQPVLAKPMHSKGGSLERHQSLMSAQNLVFYNTKPPPPHFTNTAERSRSIERNTYFHAYRQQMKTSMECDALPEEIYDFGGVGLKTCVSAKQQQQPQQPPMMMLPPPIELGHLQASGDFMQGIPPNMPTELVGIISPHNYEESLRNQREWERQWMLSGGAQNVVAMAPSMSEGAACMATLQAEAMGNQVWPFIGHVTSSQPIIFLISLALLLFFIFLSILVDFMLHFDLILKVF